MRAIIVSVDYSDLLAITLPYNRHHFDEVCVVTDYRCESEIRNLILPNSPTPLVDVKLFVTDSFYENGAKFNKWLALERGLDWFGRHGWLCIMDADVLWPKNVSPPFKGIGGREIPGACIGNLFTPRRRMWEEWPSYPGLMVDGQIVKLDERQTALIPKESEWWKFPLHRNDLEFAGYTQIFHASDPHLGPAPWHQVDWKHAGGADSFFQDKWTADKKVRPSFEVLHLGPAGQNWYGRATTLADGSRPEGADEKLEMIGKIWTNRRDNRAFGRPHFEGEKL
jgi:hypothetical protein